HNLTTPIAVSGNNRNGPREPIGRLAERFSMTVLNPRQMGRIDTQESGKLVGRKSGVLAKELDLVPGQQSTLANDFTRKEIMKLFAARDDRKLRDPAPPIVDVAR